MNFTEKYLTPYGLFGDQSFEEFCATIPEFYFREEVPEDVRENFEVVKELLAHSYYAYKSIDEAYSKALLTFEMAVRLKGAELNANKKNFDLNGTIHKLNKLGVFETQLDYLKYVQMVRNNFAHPERHSFGGSVYWHRIESISFLINEMYEDIPLRKKRKRLFDEFIGKQKTANLDRYLILENGDQKIILFSMELRFINNKFRDPHYLLACTPIFNLDMVGESAINTPTPYKVMITDPVFVTDNLVTKHVPGNQPIIFSTLEEHKPQQDEFNTWYAAFEIHKMKLFYEHTVRSNFPEITVEAVREFQKM